MALTPQSGSSTSTSSPKVAPKAALATEEKVEHHAPFITNSALNKYALDPTGYPELNKTLVGFMRGKRVSVTYYRLLNRESTNNRTNVVDLPSARNVLGAEYQKIRNLEITLPKGFEFEADNAKASMSIKGQAMFYPNMNPNIGDLFTMETGDGRIGICRISSVTPMSWRTDRVYTVDFVVHEFATAANHDPTEGAVTITSVFIKENYLGGTAALLSEETVLHLQKIRDARTNLCRFFHAQFFDRGLCSYVRPDGVYDPCLVKFMSGKITLNDLKVRPKNLLGQIPHIYQYSLWARLESVINTSLYLVYPYYQLRGYDQTRMGVFVTELNKRAIVMPTAESEFSDYYLYSENFYKSLADKMTPEELMVHKAILERKSPDLSTLITDYLDTVLTLTPIDQFYKIPIYIHLIDMALLPQYREVDAPSMSLAAEGH